jgi:predicted transcriptional regulator
MNKTTEKTVVINNFRLGSENKKKLEEIAEREQRTLAGQIRLALHEWLEQKSARPGRGAAAKH